MPDEKMMSLDSLISFEDARDIIDSHIKPVLSAESLPIDDALGRVLAQDVVATHFAPPFDRAGVDGYAVRAEDTFGATPNSPRILRVIETVYAGAVPAKKLSAGEAIQTATGAKMPVGADAMVMLEDTSRVGEEVSIFKSVSPRDSIATRGEDIKKGEIVLNRGMVLDPGKVGVLASQGICRISVFGKPKIAIMPTGEEIVAIGDALAEGQIYDINSHTLSAVVRANGGIPVELPITGDDPNRLKANLAKALEFDMVVTSGGSSVGEKDLLFDMLKSLGKVLFHGIKIKPGKPTTFALVRGKPVMGMPGYPTSCLINAHLLLVPAVRKMAHLPPERDFTLKVRLGESVSGNTGRLRFLPVRIEGDEAYSVFKESGAITSISRADGYIAIPAGMGSLPAGIEVMVSLF